MNSKPEKEDVTDVVGLSRLHGLEVSALLHWIFEFGEEEGLVRSIEVVSRNGERGVRGSLARRSASGHPQGFSSAN